MPHGTGRPRWAKGSKTLTKKRKTSAPAAKKANKAPKRPTNKPFAQRFPPSASLAAKALATNVRRRREQHGLSQAALAKASKTGQAMIGLIELGRCNPTLNLIESVAKALKTTSVALLSKPVRPPAENV